MTIDSVAIATAVLKSFFAVDIVCAAFEARCAGSPHPLRKVETVEYRA